MKSASPVLSIADEGAPKTGPYVLPRGPVQVRGSTGKPPDPMRVDCWPCAILRERDGTVVRTLTIDAVGG